MPAQKQQQFMIRYVRQIISDWNLPEAVEQGMIQSWWFISPS